MPAEQRPPTLNVWDVSMPDDIWIKWMGRYQATAELDVELIIWIRRAGAGKQPHLASINRKNDYI